MEEEVVVVVVAVEDAGAVGEGEEEDVGLDWTARRAQRRRRW
jgi:hypothetical protein